MGMKISGTSDISEKPTYIGLANEFWSHGNTFLLHESLFVVAFLIAVCSTFSADRHGRKNEIPLMSVH